MRKNNFKNLIFIAVFLLAPALICGCGGGGGEGSSILSHTGLTDGQIKVPVAINLSVAPGAAALPATAVGSVEISIYRGAAGDAGKVLFNITRVEFSARAAEIGVFAGDTYSIVLNAKAKSDPASDIEFVYRSSVDSLFVPIETGGMSGSYAAPLTMRLEQTAQIKLYPAKIAFAPLEKRTIKYGDTYKQISLTVYDQFGRIFEGAKDSVALSADPLDNTAITPLLQGNLTAVPVNGMVFFSDISILSDSLKSGVTRFAAAISASASSASSVTAKSEDILIYNQSNKPVISKLIFEKQPLPLVSAGQTWEPFTVRLSINTAILSIPMKQ